MSVFAIADLHLSFGVPEKTMEAFGLVWKHYAEKIESAWREFITEEDLVLVAGDISWAMSLEKAQIDLEWIGNLPGTKVMIKGNHDYWWSSLAKVQTILPPSCHLIQNNAFSWKDCTIGGARLWDTDEYDFSAYIDFQETNVSPSEEPKPTPAKIFNRELNRLELSLQALDPNATHRLVMTHYPPISSSLASSKVSALLEKYRIDICVFGHLHNVKPKALPFGETRGVAYYLTSCDYLDFKPIKILE
ncbi:MAG: 3',5'-cyclic adenosine monophosphate phosphodiesterase CpdA [Chlamydiae bacterium]|nr:3',5'-cyclic adenosine monophosphate phosphodiesterase CpdA [Chlamydiota bacterium]